MDENNNVTVPITKVPGAPLKTPNPRPKIVIPADSSVRRRLF